MLLVPPSGMQSAREQICTGNISEQAFMTAKSPHPIYPRYILPSNCAFILRALLVDVSATSRVFPHRLSRSRKTNCLRVSHPTHRKSDMIQSCLPLAFTPSGVLNMLSFLAVFPDFPRTEKSCHLFFPASSSLFAFTFLGTFGGLTGPSLTLLGSFFA